MITSGSGRRTLRIAARKGEKGGLTVEPEEERADMGQELGGLSQRVWCAMAGWNSNLAVGRREHGTRAR